MTRPLSDALNESNPNKIPNALHDARTGSAMSKNMVQFATLAVASDVGVLPEGVKADQIISCFSRAGTLTGHLTPVAPETTPATGECAVSPTGDIECAAADAVTSLEVAYVPAEGDVVEDTVTVAASSATLLQGRRARKILSVEVTAGVIPGAKTVVARGATPGAGEAAVGDLGAAVAFNAADVVAGTAVIRYIATPSQGTGVADSLSDRLLGGVSY